MAEILGSGVAFPLQVDRRGGIALASDETDVDQAIHLILSTAKGERPMRPEFGCGVHDFVFDTIDATTVAQMEGEVRDALDHWEPRIEVVDVDFDLVRRGPRRAADQHRLPHALHEPPAQPRLPLLHHPRRGRRALRLPEIQLDDRRFQDLVSEARLKINRACPEWTEHNVSDPGITLIELFAWMTEMTIYRLNRVPDKLHVALLDLLGIQLDGPTAARTAVRFRLAGAPEEPVEIPGGETEVATPRTPNEESIVFQVDEDFVIPAMRPSAYVVQRANQIKDVGLADGDRAPAGRRPAPVRQPAGGRRRALPRLRRAARAAADRRSTSTPRRRAAPASTRRTRRCAGRSPRATAAGPRPRCSRTSPAASTTARAPSSCSCPSAARSSRSAATACTGCAAGSTTRRATAARRRRTRTRPRSTRSPRCRSARCCRPRTPRASRTSCSACPTARPARCSRCATARCSSRGTGETLEVQDPESGDWSTWERREDFVGSTEFDRHFVLDPVSGEIELGPGDPRDRRRLDPVRRGAAEGRGAALLALPPRRRPARQRHGRRADGAAQHDPGRRHGHEPAARRSAASTPRRSSTRASARRWRSARATAPSPRRTSSSSPARRRRASRARSASRPTTAAPCRCTSSRTSTRPTASSPTPSSCPTRELMQEVARLPRRAPPDRHDRAAAAVQVPRPVGRRQPAGLAARRHRARRGGRLARALHVPQPARRRLGRRARARAGRSAARSTRASSTASCTRSTASSS